VISPPPTPHWTDSLSSGPYRWTMLAAIVLSAAWWFHRSKRDTGLLPIYIGALGGAFLGAKLVYLFAEGWRDWPLHDRWLRLATGKSVLGGLLGGYAGVEAMKWLTGYRKPTGDLFAFIAPLGIALGRVGCWLQGCCQGRVTSRLRIPPAQGFVPQDPPLTIETRWPAPQVELAFQLVVFALFLVLRNNPCFRHRLFFLYLAMYGAFRFTHEYMRDTPILAAGLSGYQYIALLTTVLGIVMFIKRGPARAETMEPQT
jgi:phosphatidylglycerol:prolipoprotein diacylglycerol transferase